MFPIAELYGEHRQLEEQARLLKMIAAAPVPDAASVAALRWQMAEALHRHSVREDREVYGLILASGDTEAIRIAWDYRREHGRLEVVFGRYIANWPVARISREWGAFRADTAGILDHLAVRMAGEETTLYVHAQRVLERRAA